MSLNLPPLEPKPEKVAVKPTSLYNKDKFAEEYKQGKKVFGIPGASLTWGIDGVHGISSLIGKDGEESTAKVLDEYAKTHEGVYVFHSIMLPNSTGDTDHILVYKNNIIIIDSKRWKSVRKYGVSASGHVLRGTVAFPEGRVKTNYAINKWREVLNKNKVFGIVCIAQDKIFVTRDRNWYRAPFRLVEIEKLVEQLDYTLDIKTPTSEQDNYAILSFLACLTVKPRNLRSELIREQGLKRE
jgi:hypothetical protein